MWHGMQGLMSHRSTVQTDSCHDPVILFQGKCNLGIIILRKIKRDDSKPVLNRLFSRNMCLWDFLYSFKKISGQFHFLLMDSRNACFFQISQGSMESDDTGKVHGTTFILIREIVRHKE